MKTNDFKRQINIVELVILSTSLLVGLRSLGRKKSINTKLD